MCILQIIFVLLQDSIAYPLIGLAPGTSQFITLVAAGFGMASFGYGLGLWLGALTGSSETAAALLPLAYL